MNVRFTREKSLTASTYDPSSNDLPVNEIVLEKVKAEIFLHPYRKQKDLIETEITLTINEGKERKNNKNKKQKTKIKKTQKQNINLFSLFFFSSFFHLLSQLQLKTKQVKMQSILLYYGKMVLRTSTVSM